MMALRNKVKSYQSATSEGLNNDSVQAGNDFMTGTKAIVAVVENDAAMLKALERVLRAHGYPSELYTSAEAFLARTSLAELGCLILDIDLGGISGIELQRMLTRNKEAPPIIFITGQSDDRYRKEAQKLGCVAYMNKPFEARLLAQALADAIDGE